MTPHQNTAFELSSGSRESRSLAPERFEKSSMIRVEVNKPRALAAPFGHPRGSQYTTLSE